ncbi:MAG: YdcF family protein [Crocinitomicaceae bacterium]|nr:YdcF family protein [Crocinitomicaceae bacterium]
MKNFLKKKWVRVWLIVFSLFFLLFLFRFPLLRGIGCYLVSEDPLESCEAYFVLGGNSFERGIETVKVHQQFPDARIIATGGNIPMQIQAFDTSLTEAALTRHLMVRRGVPDTLITILEHSTSTFEESNEILAYCKKSGYKKITLISSSFHLRRMRWVFSKKFSQNGIKVLFHGASDTSFDKDNWWRNETSLITCNNEYVKLVYYLLHY